MMSSAACHTPLATASTAVRRLCVLIIMLWLLILPAHAQEAPPTCTNPGASGQTLAPPSRLPSLRYTCITLGSGKHLLVGETGQPQKPAVVLIHGLGASAHRDWDNVLPALSAHFRVITIDLPGFGASNPLPQGYSFAALASILNEVLNQTHAGRVHLVGHSLGGAISLYFSHVYPERVNRLVLVDAAGILHKTVFMRHMTRIELPPVDIPPVDEWFAVLDRRLNGWRRAMLRGLEDRFDFSRWLHEHPRVRNALIGNYTHVDAALGLIEHDFTDAIFELATPTTLIWGRDDPIAPLRTGQLLAGRLPLARLEIMDQVGHVPMSEDPAGFLQRLLPALQEPLAFKPADEATPRSSGAVECRDRNHVTYSGDYERLALIRCHDVRIDRARLGQLTLESSSATLTDAVIESPDTALIAKNSRLVVTATAIRGATGLMADSSDIDLAGVTLQATDHGIDSRSESRLYFSVSRLFTPEYTGNAHFIWPPGRLR